MSAAPPRRRPREEEEEDPPPRPRRALRDEEPDAAPRRRRPAPDEEEDPPDEEPEDYEYAPRGRRAAGPSRDVEDRPRRRPGGSRAPAGRAGRAPAGRPGGPATVGRLASGWGSYQKIRAASSDFETKYKPSTDGDVVQLLQGEPFAAFARHWVEVDGGKRAVICPASLEVDEDDDPPQCPLCDVGDKPNPPKAYLNVAVLRPPAAGRPENAVWEIGGSISDQLQTIDKGIGRKTSLVDIFLLASSSGTGLNTKYLLEPLFEEDLAEFGVKPLTDKQIAGFDLYGPDLYEVPSFRELDKLADEIS